MGTYTANYNLYLPTVGEQGWGELMNGNLTTIDTTMKSLSNRITAVEGEVNGALSCTSVTTSGTITSAGKITANGGIGATSLTTSSTITSTGLITGNGGFKGNLTGNVTGKINVSTNASSGDLKVLTISYPSNSIAKTAYYNTSKSMTLAVGTVTKHNTAILNYTGSTSFNSTCTITILFNGRGDGYGTGAHTLLVTDSSGSTLINEDISGIVYYNVSTDDYRCTVTKTFSRSSANTYTVKLTGPTNANYGSSATVSVSTPNVNRYLPQ